jgi:SET domain-containing protein
MEEVPHIIDKVNPLVGFGVFATQSIPYLTYIGEYAGELRARKRKTDRSNNYIFGYMVGFFGTPWIIDASKKGNFTRFINHSFHPNVNSRGVIVDGLYHIIFFANRRIEKGEQLTYDYGPTYWNKRSYPQEF